MQSSSIIILLLRSLRVYRSDRNEVEFGSAKEEEFIFIGNHTNNTDYCVTNVALGNYHYHNL